MVVAHRAAQRPLGREPRTPRGRSLPMISVASRTSLSSSRRGTGSAVRSPLSRMNRARSWRAAVTVPTSTANCPPWRIGSADALPIQRPGTGSRRLDGALVVDVVVPCCCGLRPPDGLTRVLRPTSWASWRQGLCSFGPVDRRHSVSTTTRRWRACARRIRSGTGAPTAYVPAAAAGSCEGGSMPPPVAVRATRRRKSVPRSAGEGTCRN